MRISRAAVPTFGGHMVRIGQGATVRAGGDVTIVGSGSMVGRGIQAAGLLAREGISARVLSMTSIKPFDADLVRQAAEETGALVTAEDHTILGGLGSAVASLLRVPALVEPSV